MQPTLIDKQVVWVNQWVYLVSKPKVGEIVVFDYFGKSLVKRVSKVFDNKIELKGDNPDDSLKIPPVRIAVIKGRVKL